MKRKTRTVGLLAAMAASLGMAGPATAALFDFGPASLGVAGSDAYGSVGMTVDGIGVDITAYTIDNDGGGTIFSSTLIDGAGLGVYVSSSNNLGVASNSGDGHDLDGGYGSSSDPDEGLLFSFSQNVRLDFIGFERFGSSDDFNLTIDGVSMLVDFGNGSTSPYAAADGSGSGFDFFDLTGQQFLVWADGGSDDFRIDTMRVSAVPEPASLLLVAAGVAGVAGLRRSRARAS